LQLIKASGLIAWASESEYILQNLCIRERSEAGARVTTTEGLDDELCDLGVGSCIGMKTVT
jgi:hypothetical protein